MADHSSTKSDKVAYLYVRTNKERHRRWVKAAKKDNRSLSSWVSHQLEIAAKATSPR